jgi:hypothetical protein
MISQKKKKKKKKFCLEKLQKKPTEDDFVFFSTRDEIVENMGFS